MLNSHLPTRNEAWSFYDSTAGFTDADTAGSIAFAGGCQSGPGQNVTWRPAPIMVLSGPLIPADRVADMSMPSRWVRPRLRLTP